MHPGVAVVLPWLVTLGCGAVQAADNIVPVEVRQLYQGDKCNKLYVAVTVCNTAQQCRTVPDVLVDTGSPGLRLFRSALVGLELDAVTARGHPVANWGRFASGALWGTLHWAEVRIGGVATTAAIPIELFDEPGPGESLPSGYGSADARSKLRMTVGNGILGISPQRFAEAGYYLNVGSHGVRSKSDWEPVKIHDALKLANPIGHFPAPYDTGSVIRLPEVDRAGGQSTAQGWLGFGLGRPTAALFPQGGRMIVHELDQRSRFAAVVEQRAVDMMLDSGSNFLVLSLDHPGFAAHPNFARCYNPVALTPIDLRFPSAGREIELARPLLVGSADQLHKARQGCAVLPTIAARPRSEPGQEGAPGGQRTNVLGLPFFYGRSVATGLQGAVNPYARPTSAGALPAAGDDGLAPVSPHGFVAYTD